MKKNKTFCLLSAVVLAYYGCKEKKEASASEKQLYQTYCASCHMAPKIDELPKAIWKENVLPDMAARMEIIGAYQDPADTEIFKPKISLTDWVRLENYIVQLAPEKLVQNEIPDAKIQKQFIERPIALDNEKGALITYFQVLENTNLTVGTYSGELFQWNLDARQKNSIAQQTTAITDYSKSASKQYITEVGILDPSEQPKGAISLIAENDTLVVQDGLHRPVNTLVEDLNGDGHVELVVSEFGNETGQLALLYGEDGKNYKEKTLLDLPGCIRTLSKDMNKDGMLDIVVMTTQGNESITILYQQEGLTFKAEKVIEFSPVYGSSWFELLDFNKDGFDDIITVNGDNADKSYVHKPYHGLRIHLNDGQNNFEEVFFYPLHGATRVLANDFDQDGDSDFAVISTFPDYQRAPELAFVYLENVGSDEFQFVPHILGDPGAGRWFLMDAGDVDADGDDDLVLTSFTYVFTPVPKELENRWNESNVDIMVLENTLK